MYSSEALKRSHYGSIMPILYSTICNTYNNVYVVEATYTGHLYAGTAS